MTETVSTAEAPRMRVNLQLLPFSLAAFLGFLAIGIPLPVLPVYVKDVLGFGPILIGIVIGAQSVATLLTRQYAGHMCDEQGPKRASLLGLFAAALAGACYIASNLVAGWPLLGLTVLLAGRLIMGFGESLFITALAAWSIARVGHAHAGRAMAWSGIAIYGAIAIGAPYGSFVEQHVGYTEVFASTIALPLLGFALVAFWKDAAVGHRPRVAFLRVLHLIWAPGLGMALASSGVGTIAAFLALRYNVLGWNNVGGALAGFGAAYIAMRLVFGGLPDRIGGTVTAMISLFVEALGLLVIWKAGSPLMAFAGATLTGLGYSLVFPSLGVEALRRAPAENRGIVLGAYLACFDLGLAGAGPVAGIIASRFELPSVFLSAAIAALIALALTATFRRGPA